MWDFRQLRWLNLFGWWPRACKSKKLARISRTAGISIYVWNNLQLVLELVSLFKEISSGSLKGTILNLTTSLMGILCFVKVGLIILYEQGIEDVINQMKAMEDRVKEVLPPGVVDSLSGKKQSFSKQNAFLAKALTLAIIHWSIRPLILLSQGQRELMIETFVPFEVEHLSLWWFVWISQTIHVFTAMYAFLLFDSIAYSLIEMIDLQIEYLKSSLRRLDFSPPGVDHHSPLTLVFCCDMVAEILRLQKKCNKLISLVLFLQTTFFTFVFCLSVFELSSNIKVMRAAYDNNWYIGNHRDKQALITLIEVWKRQYKFGFIIESDLQTFIAIMKSSFTYYNFLKAISGGEM